MRLRIAPSPTGKLHLGTVRTALFNYLAAKNNNGTFVIRIEDTDTQRSLPEYEKEIIEGLQWLGIDSDEGPCAGGDYGPYRQSERLELYDQYMQQLIDAGYAYEAWETPDEIGQMRDASMKRTKTFVYRKQCYTDEQIAQFKAEGRTSVIRFAVPQGRIIVWQDSVKGETSFETDLIGDFVIRKGDGMPTYHFAVVVDDHLMNISHVLRGEDHIANTPKHIMLFEAFDWSLPDFGHMPLIMTPQKKKMSKRTLEQGFVYIDQYQEQGFLPVALINFIALLGWHTANDDEIFDHDALVDVFRIDRIQSSNAVFDYDRLLWFNAYYIRQLTIDECRDALLTYLRTYGGQRRDAILALYGDKRGYRDDIVTHMQSRMQFFGQFREFGYYFFEPQYPTDELLYKKKMKVTPGLLREILPLLVTFCETCENWDSETLQSLLGDWIATKGYKNGQVLWPVRCILTGVAASPGAYEMMALLGKKETILRLKTFYSALCSDDPHGPTETNHFTNTLV